jgi:hypothetical protein
VPSCAVFDYTVTHNAPPALTADGAMDGLAHILEVFYGAVHKPYYGRSADRGSGFPVVTTAQVKPILQIRRPAALCLARSGGYAIMLGGTNGGHLTSFAGRYLESRPGLRLMNPYYTVFFAPASRSAAWSRDSRKPATSRRTFASTAGLGSPSPRHVRLRQGNRLSHRWLVPGFTRGHIDRALTAAKSPQLKMKLENMPVPLTAERIDDTMGPILKQPYGSVTSSRTPAFPVTRSETRSRVEDRCHPRPSNVTPSARHSAFGDGFGPSRDVNVASVPTGTSVHLQPPISAARLANPAPHRFVWLGRVKSPTTAGCDLAEPPATGLTRPARGRTIPRRDPTCSGSGSWRVGPTLRSTSWPSGLVGIARPGVLRHHVVQGRTRSPSKPRPQK